MNGTGRFALGPALNSAVAIEIERKFLVRGDTWRVAAATPVAMAQAYLGGDRCSVRVRIEGDEVRLNIKSKTRGARRLEFEYPIPLADAECMLRELAGTAVTKKRHGIRFGAHLWEVDEFDGANHGLVIAEIELEDIAESFERPSWLGREVTDDERFYNAALAQLPFDRWPDRAAILEEMRC